MSRVHRAVVFLFRKPSPLRFGGGAVVSRCLNHISEAWHAVDNEQQIDRDHELCRACISVQLNQRAILSGILIVPWPRVFIAHAVAGTIRAIIFFPLHRAAYTF